MNVISWNVNGLRAVVKNGFVDFLKQSKPDIIGLQEIKISNQARLKQKFDFQDYFEYWNPAVKPGYSGTAVLSKNKPVSVKNGINIKKFDKEGRVQALEYPEFYFVNAYFPNAQHELARIDFKIEFNKEFLKYLKKLDKKKPVIVCGDFNVAREEIDLKNPETNRENAGFSELERKWARKYLEAGFVDTFRHFYPTKVQYSWWTYRFQARKRNIGWRIDYFLVSIRMIKQIKKAHILDKVMGSDHAPVGIELK
ncbi:MAG: exodeoxyribonuclease III [bacterium]